MQGYIYILVNPSMQGMVKIGKTTRTPEERAKELSVATGIPFDFHVGYEKLVKDCDLAERLIQEKLKEHRTAKNREFFTLPLKEAIQAVAKIIDDENLGIIEKTIWDYKFLGEFYNNANDLMKAFVKNETAWEDAKIHIQKGYIQKWLEDIKDFDALVQIHKAIDAQYASFDDTLTQIIYSINPKMNFSYLGQEINDIVLYQIIEKVCNDKSSTTEIKLIEDFINGKLYCCYNIYSKFTKNYVNSNFLANLKWASEVNDSNKKNKIRKLTMSLRQDVTSDFIYNGSITYDEIDYLMLKEDFENINNKYVLPLYIETLLFSKEKSQYLNGVRDLRNLQDKLVPKNYTNKDAFVGSVLVYLKTLINAKSTYEYNRIVENKSEYLIFIPEFEKIEKEYLLPTYIKDTLLSKSITFEKIKESYADDSLVAKLLHSLKENDDFLDVAVVRDFWAFKKILVKKDTLVEENLFTPIRIIYDALLQSKSIGEYEKVLLGIVTKEMIESIKATSFGGLIDTSLLHSDIQTYIDLRNSLVALQANIEIYQTYWYFPRVQWTSPSELNNFIESLKSNISWNYKEYKSGTLPLHPLFNLIKEFVSSEAEKNEEREIWLNQLKSLNKDEKSKKQQAIESHIYWVHELKYSNTFSSVVTFYVEKIFEQIKNNYYYDKTAIAEYPFRIIYYHKSENNRYFIRKSILEQLPISASSKQKIRNGEAEGFIEAMKYQNTDLANSCGESEWLSENWLSEVIPLKKATSVESMKATRVYLLKDIKIGEHQGKPLEPVITIKIYDKTIVRRIMELPNIVEQEFEHGMTLRLKYRLFKDYHHIIYEFNDDLTQQIINHRLFYMAIENYKIVALERA